MVTTLLYATLGLALALILRLPMRRLFGATPAFTLWLLPPMLALLPCLPSSTLYWIDLPQLAVFPASQALAAQIAPSASSTHAVFLLWAVGAVLLLLRLALHYHRLLRESRPLPAAMSRVLQSDWPGLDPRRLRLHPAGPALLWAPRCLILLPTDFLDRFDTRQRSLVLQHEHTHLRRGDALWSLLSELTLALLWFHPLAWLARPRLRLDQELACDECVLRQSPQDESSYAHTLLHSTGVEPTPMFIPWLTQPQLKERLNMIQRPRPSTLRRRLGFTALAVLMTGTIFMAQAAVKHDPGGIQSSPKVMGIVTHNPPPYPESAIKNKEEGTVVLTILVGVDGTPLKFKVDSTTQAAPDLIRAASDWVMFHWRFEPELKDGKPIQGYARVPISFKLSTPAPTSSSAAPSALPASSKI